MPCCYLDSDRVRGTVPLREDEAPPDRSTLLRIGLPMGLESFVGAAAGGAFAGTASAEVLELTLGVILVRRGV